MVEYEVEASHSGVQQADSCHKHEPPVEVRALSPVDGEGNERAEGNHVVERDH
jgi:hypothetical protein